jgi:DNA-binding protein
MSQESNPKVIVIQPSDALLVTDIVEKIISGIMETGEINVVGINDSIFPLCSAINTATEIAKVYVNDIGIANLEGPILSKTSAMSAYLSQKQIWDYAKCAEQEDKEMSDIAEQTISVSRAATMDRLLTISLLRLAKYDEVKIVAAGGSINDAISLALELTAGKISKEPIGIKLFHLYSILMRNDPTKSIAAVSIYLHKDMTTRYTKMQSDLFKKLASGSKKE